MGQSTEDESERLPAVTGGWELSSFSVTSEISVELWAPCAPQSLQRDEVTHDRSRFHDSMPYWAWMWDAAPVMARQLATMDVRGRVLEVGAGLGLVGIAVAAARPDLVELTLSDIDPMSVAAMRVNAERNGLSRAEVWQLDWCDLAGVDAEPFDFVVGCEVIYDGQSHGALLDLLERFVKRDGGQALIADPGRTRVPQFLKRARARGFSVEVLDGAGAPAEPEAGEFRLLRLAR